MKVKQVISLLGLVGLLLLIVLDRHQFESFWHLIRNIRLYILLLIILVHLFSYYLNALYYRSILRVFGYQVYVARLFQGALATNFVNYVFPSAGLGGAAFLSQALKPAVPRGEGFLTQIVRYALSSLATLLMVPVAIILLLVGQDNNKKVFIVTLVSSLVILVFGIVMVAVVALREQWVRRVFKRISLKFKKTYVERFADDFYRGFRIILNNLSDMLVPFGWSIAYIVAEVFTLYLAFLAFGKVVNPGLALMGYILANVASFFGGTIISLGAFELSLTGTLVALGQPLSLAISVTLVYRIMSLIVGLPPGFVFYRKFLT
jgi:uncharacterized protein (TIRG00374 family)